MSVLVIGAIISATTVFMLQVGLGADRTSDTVRRSHVAREYAQSCTEEALERLSRDTSYTGGDTLTFDEGDCTVDTVAGSGSTNRTVQVTGNSGDVVRKIEVEVSDVGPPMTISTWQDVADF